MKQYTREELEQHDGRDGREAWVAYRGRVYDVTHSFLWQEGRHQALHHAGRDLTEALEQAPHGKEFLERTPVIGILVERGK